MHTLILQNRARETSSGNTWTITVLGADNPTKASLKNAIGELEHHPAKAARRSIIDMLTLIENHNLTIKHTEYNDPENGLESWLFVLQG